MDARPRILVVDDERGIRLLLEKGLSGLGYEIQAVTDAKQALATFREHGHDLVITDIVMPGVTGWELVTYLRTIDTAVPIIVFSGYGRSLEEEAARRRVFLLHKPLRLHEIARVVGQVVTALRTGRPPVPSSPAFSPAMAT